MDGVTALKATKAGGHDDVVEVLRQVVMADFKGKTRGIDDLSDPDERDSPLLPSWFDKDNLDEPPGVAMPTWETSHAWDNDEDPLSFNMPRSPQEFSGTVMPVTPLQRAIAL